MVIAMLFAHLVGDYILQWDSLAAWKSRSLRGVLVHGAIVWIVAWLCALPFDPGFWPWVNFIGVTHIAIDAAQLPLNRRLATVQNGIVSLGRFMTDQALHIVVIGLALLGGGFLDPHNLPGDFAAVLSGNRLLLFALGYAFISMPAWILLQFLVYGLVNGSAPDFSHSSNKYVGTLERWLIATFVLLGQFLLVPLVTLPRVVLDGRSGIAEQHRSLYVAELLASVALAVVIGLGLRYL